LTPRPTRPDADALLAALVLAPDVYSRNRFFELYRDTDLRRVRARATQLRGVVRHLGGGTRIEGLERREGPDGSVKVRYGIASLKFRRSLTLSRFEAALIDVALARARNEAPPADAGVRVSEVLRRLADAALRPVLKPWLKPAVSRRRGCPRASFRRA
jgi:hypothetical protein